MITNIIRNVKFKFAVMGVISTMAAYFSFPLLYDKLFQNGNFLICYIISTLFNISISFLGQKYYVFRSSKKIYSEFSKFLFGATSIIIINYLILYVAVIYLNFNSYLVNIIVVSISAVASYALHSNFTFITDKK